MQYLLNAADFLWSHVIGYVLLAVGLYYSLRLGFPQFKYSGQIKKVLRKNLKSSEGVSGFAALATAVGGQVGTGSLVGVASAIAYGGPGAIFWMWITALLGMIITFAETVLGQLYRVKLDDGTYRGGPAYYVQNGLHSRVFAVITAFFYIIGVGLCIAFMQSNSISQAFTGVVDANPIWPGIVVAIAAAIITIGGVKRLTNFSSRVVPVMAGAYVLVVLIIVITNITKFPAVIGLIFKSAFTAQAAVGGIIGHTVMDAFRHGVARGLFSNDAGNGIAGIMHAAADVKHPAEQGFLGMFGTFVTTIIICSLSAFSLLLTGVVGDPANGDGIVLVQDAFQTIMGIPGRWLVFFAMLMFGFTTLIADLFYGESNIILIFKEKYKVPLWIYRIIAFIMFIVATQMDLELVWGFIDVFVGIVVIINVISLFLLFKDVRMVLNDYKRQLDEGIEDPVWHREKEYHLHSYKENKK
ncbi:MULTISPECIES: sodium:alanine symporter family protein [Anaerococcus]|uniref:alanine/glycine:cation symporter family protein n=1 Tax=Anaerococcus TaxID=165779 RepID=UPI001AE490BC|nr:MULTISPECIES: sodium:alanine symporter family protein [Anaerococcus]MBP2069556.1 AGCS family alanine or glycine:cation symporter [Anaerococcus nagyae]MDU2565408.1 sodium:alanine symporter family protein [Anaerococcus sp.]